MKISKLTFWIGIGTALLGLAACNLKPEALAGGGRRDGANNAVQGYDNKCTAYRVVRDTPTPGTCASPGSPTEVIASVESEMIDKIRITLKKTSDNGPVQIVSLNYRQTSDGKLIRPLTCKDVTTPSEESNYRVWLCHITGRFGDFHEHRFDSMTLSNWTCNAQASYRSEVCPSVSETDIFIGKTFFGEQFFPQIGISEKI